MVRGSEPGLRAYPGYSVTRRLGRSVLAPHEKARRRPSKQSVSIGLVKTCTMDVIAGLRCSAARNCAGGICSADPGADDRRHGERKPPSADVKPIAPSWPIIAVATVCPFGSSMIAAIAPL